MWFQFPIGTTRLTVNQQEFSSEFSYVEGENTFHCFRAPDHFAPQILDLPGFAAVMPKKGMPKDLPRSTQASTIDMLAGSNEALKLELENVKALLAETSASRDDWKLKATEFETQLKNALEDLKVTQESSVVLGSGGKK